MLHDFPYFQYFQFKCRISFHKHSSYFTMSPIEITHFSNPKVLHIAIIVKRYKFESKLTVSPRIRSLASSIVFYFFSVFFKSIKNIFFVNHLFTSMVVERLKLTIGVVNLVWIIIFYTWLFRNYTIFSSVRPSPSEFSTDSH